MNYLEHINIEAIVEIAKNAGAEILDVYSRQIVVENKDDKSPLTKADKRANDVIVKGLNDLEVKLPIISEETKLMDYAERKKWDWLWLVDPLDGTKEFIKRNGEFTVNIALVHEGRVVLGVIYIPVTDVTYYAIEDQGAYRIVKDEREILTMATPSKDKTLHIVASRSHNSPEVLAYVEELKKEYNSIEFVAAGSSLKFCLVAEGKAHVYPRLAPTMEWDTGAGQIIAKEAGAKVVKAGTSEELDYNKENLLNPFFIVKHPNL